MTLLEIDEDIQRNRRVSHSSKGKLINMLNNQYSSIFNTINRITYET